VISRRIDQPRSSPGHQERFTSGAAFGPIRQTIRGQHAKDYLTPSSRLFPVASGTAIHPMKQPSRWNRRHAALDGGPPAELTRIALNPD
jgi:hypothetical protein